LKKQPASKATRKARRAAPVQKKIQYPRLVEFPQARGRTVERVELNLDSDFHYISIRFQDETDLTFVIDPALTFRADYSKWKDGEQKILKRWSPISIVGM
jgi:N-dimethylarginine dimethylaminohydrolase